MHALLRDKAHPLPRRVGKLPASSGGAALRANAAILPRFVRQAGRFFFLPDARP